MDSHTANAKSIVLMRLFVMLAILLNLSGQRLAAQAATGLAAKSSASQSGLPDCSQPLPSLPYPKGPHGLFAIFFPGNQFTEEADTYLIHNPVVCGGLFDIVWAQVDKGPGASPRYDWTPIERQIEPWMRAGKLVALDIWAVSYGGLEATPSYVLSQVDSVRCVGMNPNAAGPGGRGRFPGGPGRFPGARPPFFPRPGFGRPGGQFPGGARGGRESPAIPVYWESGFEKNYREFIAAVIEKYGSNPSVAYIRPGLGAGGESTPRCGQQMRQYGYSIDKWRQYVFDMIDFEKSLHSRATLIVGITNPEGSRAIEFPHLEAARAVEDGLGIGSEGLQESDIENNSAGRPCGVVDRCALFETYKGRAPLELQTLSRSNPDGNGRVGSLVDILPLGLKIHAQIFEIYTQDFLAAYDPAFPDYDRHHAAYQQALEQTAAVVGGKP
ncbi:MAG TPA: hypothetical protein VGW33_12385 [Terriglobia bacterium]|nr:hypothetical protein [Terriglobia bacterium]